MKAREKISTQKIYLPIRSRTTLKKEAADKKSKAGVKKEKTEKAPVEKKSDKENA